MYMYVYVYVYIYIYTHIHTYAYTYNACLSLHICIHIYIYIYVCIICIYSRRQTVGKLLVVCLCWSSSNGIRNPNIPLCKPIFKTLLIIIRPSARKTSPQKSSQLPASAKRNSPGEEDPRKH